MGIHWLRQLDGMKVEALLQAEGITSEDVAELQRLIGLLGSVKPVPYSPARRAPKYPPTDLRHLKPPETIDIPSEFRGQPITAFKFSARLGHFLAYKAIRVLGNLHGLSYQELLDFPKCGRKTMDELREIIRRVQGNAAEGSPKLSDDLLLIPGHSQEVRVSDLDLSPRLATGLARLKVNRLGDLQTRNWRDFKGQSTFGQQTMAELRRLVERAQAGEFNPAAIDPASLQPARVVPLLDKVLAQVNTSKYRDILRCRFGAKTGQFATLQEVGSQFGLTRERIRQIVDNQLDRMRKLGGPLLRALLGKMASDCCEAVCPLTPDLFAAWLKSSGTPAPRQPVFYLHLLSALSPKIPIWPNGQDPAHQKINWNNEVRRILRAGFEKGRHGLPLKEVLESLHGHRRHHQLTPREFLDGLQTSSRFPVIFSDPHQPELHLNRLPPTYWARVVLLASSKPLQPEEILARAQARFGTELIKVKGQGLAHSLTLDKEFHMLGPRAYGLRQHFQLPKPLWEPARAEFARFLEKEHRPVSTPEIINASLFPWTSQTNAYELAEVLRGDATFVDLGKFLFALATWGVTERAHVKDLIPQVLAEAGHPLTTIEVVERLTRLRSVSPYSMTAQLRRHPLVREVSLRCFGLKSWDESGRAPATPDGGPG